MSVEGRRAERLRVLRDTELFAPLPIESLALVTGAAREVPCPANGIVVREGAPGDGLYVVVRGDLQVLVAQSDGEEMVLAHLGPGEIFGAQYVFGESGLNSATV